MDKWKQVCQGPGVAAGVTQHPHGVFLLCPKLALPLVALLLFACTLENILYEMSHTEMYCKTLWESGTP